MDTHLEPNPVPEFTVSQFSFLFKRMVETSFQKIRIRGEISGLKLHGSGHLYFSLKDAEAVLDAVCWRGSVGALGFTPADGLEVWATGRITTYPGRSKYQMVVESFEVAGLGALLKLLEERKQKLMAEGLFAPERKRPLPFLPRLIGIVTSPTGAVIQDIMHRLEDRFPTPVLLWPVLVQGEGAAAQITAALEGFNRLSEQGIIPRPDLLIVARGGGSVEDLWAFNEESVVRAVAQSGIPVISAVGHETDTTLVDYAADRRAPTPTAAAEMAVPVRLDLLATLDGLGQRSARVTLSSLQGKRAHLGLLSRSLRTPQQVIEAKALRLDDWSDRLAQVWQGRYQSWDLRLGSLAGRLVPPTGVWSRLGQTVAFLGERLGGHYRRSVEIKAQTLGNLSHLLENLSCARTLQRGFTLVTDASGGVIATAQGAQKDTPITVHWHDGHRTARLE